MILIIEANREVDYVKILGLKISLISFNEGWAIDTFPGWDRCGGE